MSPNCAIKNSNIILQNDTVKSSLLMSSRRRPLPSFETTRECPKCGKRITSISEETLGPKASKWHKKCLVCEGCNKMLDSSAAVIENKITKNILYPLCTTCVVSIHEYICRSIKGQLTNLILFIYKSWIERQKNHGKPKNRATRTVFLAL